MKEFFSKGWSNKIRYRDEIGDYCESEKLNKQALEIWKKVYDDDHTEVINCKLNLQICLHHANNKDFNLNELKTCIRLLQERNDPRSEKGLSILRELCEEI